MASWSEEHLRCPVCLDVFKDPVLLSCCHSLCNACWKRWWREKSTHQCPVCKTKSLFYDPPRNLALKNLSEAFSAERHRSRSAALCSLHSEDLKLFCLDHQQPVCVICLHSSSHINHSFRPIAEAAVDYKEVLRELLKPLQEQLELFNDIKTNFDRTAEDVEVQAKDTERQINDEFSMLQKLLQKEQGMRIEAVRKEKKQKSQTLKRRMEALSREIAALSDTVRTTEELLRAEDLSFLHNYKDAAQIASSFHVNDPQPIAGGLIDTTKHLNNLPVAVLDNIKKIIPSSDVLDHKSTPERRRYRPENQGSSANSSLMCRLKQSSVEPPSDERLDRTADKSSIPPPPAPTDKSSHSVHVYDHLHLASYTL